jgi:FAD-linked sulfhydryl oxidase
LQGESLLAGLFSATLKSRLGQLCTSSAGFQKLLKISKPASGTKKPQTQLEYERHCPPDVEILGRHTWTFLHTTAAFYPDAPKAPQKQAMLGFLNNLPSLYPCSHCADELKEEIKRCPVEPAVESRSALGLWMCQIHNQVNERLGKDAFDCSKVNLRWRDGWPDKSCE